MSKPENNSVSIESTGVSSRAAVRRWHDHAEEWLTGALGRFLEYGCGSCLLTTRVAHRCDKCFGVDVDEKKIESARERFPEYELSVIGFDGRTSFASDYFDTAAIIEVIEHVPNERVALEELTRVLKPGGRLVLTTPHRGLLTFLDAGNFKFAFPRLHRFIHVRLRGSRDEYEERFLRVSERGMVGDITATGSRRPWHRHYTPQQIMYFCPRDLVCEKYGVFFPAMRALILFRLVLRVCTFDRVKSLFWPFSWLERRLSRIESRFGDQLVMLFRKKES